MAFRPAGTVSIVLLGVLGHLPLAGQSPELDARRADPVLRVGVTYLGVDTDQGPTAAVELAYLGSTPRIWRAGIMGGLIASAQRTVYGYGGLHVPVPLPMGLIARDLHSRWVSTGRGGAWISGVLSNSDPASCSSVRSPTGSASQQCCSTYPMPDWDSRTRGWRRWDLRWPYRSLEGRGSVGAPWFSYMIGTLGSIGGKT